MFHVKHDTQAMPIVPNRAADSECWTVSPGASRLQRQAPRPCVGPILRGAVVVAYGSKMVHVNDRGGQLPFSKAKAAFAKAKPDDHRSSPLNST